MNVMVVRLHKELCLHCTSSYKGILLVYAKYSFATAATA